MLKYRHHVLRSGYLKQARPCDRVEMLRLEQGNEVFVPELVRRAVGRQMVLVLLRVRSIHVAGIPFAAKRRHGVNAPVNEDPELGVAIPIGYFVLLERLPVGTKRPLLNRAIDLLQDGCTLRLILAACLLP